MAARRPRKRGCTAADTPSIALKMLRVAIQVREFRAAAAAAPADGDAAGAPRGEAAEHTALGSGKRKRAAAAGNAGKADAGRGPATAPKPKKARQLAVHAEAADTAAGKQAARAVKEKAQADRKTAAKAAKAKAKAEADAAKEEARAAKAAKTEAAKAVKALFAEEQLRLRAEAKAAKDVTKAAKAAKAAAKANADEELRQLRRLPPSAEEETASPEGVLVWVREAAADLTERYSRLAPVFAPLMTDGEAVLAFADACRTKLHGAYSNAVEDCSASQADDACMAARMQAVGSEHRIELGTTLRALHSRPPADLRAGFHML